MKTKDLSQLKLNSSYRVSKAYIGVTSLAVWACFVFFGFGFHDANAQNYERSEVNTLCAVYWNRLYNSVNGAVNDVLTEQKDHEKRAVDAAIIYNALCKK